MTTTTTATPLDTTPVRAKNGLVFLEATPYSDGTVRIRATDLGKKKLGKYWLVWLYTLIKSKVDTRDVFSAEIRGNEVHASWSSQSEHLVKVVSTLAAQIRPLYVPIRRYKGKPSLGIEWVVIQPKAMPLTPSEIIASVKLPAGAKVEVLQGETSIRKDNHVYIVLNRDPSCIMSGRELELIVEYHFAIACA
jgi:hypothetical protein